MLCCEDSSVSKNEHCFKVNSGKFCHLIHRRSNHHYFTTVSRTAWDSEQGGAGQASVGSFWPSQSSCSLSGHQSLHDCPQDPSRCRHMGPILLAVGRGVLNSPTHAFLRLPASESEWGRMRAGNGERHYMGAEEDGRSRRPLP